MNWVIRTAYIFSELLNALIFIVFHYPRRKNSLKNLLLSLPADPLLMKKMAARVKQYIPPFLLIEFYYSRASLHPMQGTQRFKSLIMNGLTPLFDDLVDEQSWENNVLKQIFISPEQLQLTGNPLVCAHLFKLGGFEWNEYWEAIFLAQIESKKQLEKSPLSKNELYAITAQKGGASVVLGWHVIGEESGGESMKNLAWCFGAYAQLVNDIFDVWKDREAGVQTLVTCTKNIHELAELHRGLQQEVGIAISGLSISLSRKHRLAASLVPLFCLADLAVERLLKLQAKSSGDFQIENYTRKELVCDMADWSNRLRYGWLIFGRK